MLVVGEIFPALSVACKTKVFAPCASATLTEKEPAPLVYAMESPLIVIVFVSISVVPTIVA